MSTRMTSDGVVSTRPLITSPAKPSIEIQSPSLTTTVALGGVHRHGARVVVERQRVAADDADLAHLTRDERRVAGHAAERGHEAERRVHAADVLGAGLVAAQDQVGLTLGGQRLRLVGEEHDLARGGARTGRQALGQQAALLDGGLLGRRQRTPGAAAG